MLNKSVQFTLTTYSNTYSTPSATSTVTSVALIAAPTGVVISSPTCHGFTVSWNAVAGAVLYNVRYTTAGGLIYNNTINGLTTTFGALGLNTTYTVKVAGINTCGTHNIMGTFSGSVAAATSVCRDGDVANVVADLNNVIVYPNPSNGQFNISFVNPAEQNVNYYITNMLGQVVYSSMVNEQDGSINKTIELNDVADGIYSVTIKTANSIVTKQVMIAK